jgi:hypothetical protein
MAKERSMALGRAEGDRQIKKAELAVEKGGEIRPTKPHVGPTQRSGNNFSQRR